MKKSKPLEFEVDKPMLFFDCTHAVYVKNGSGSICYCTSEERAKFVAEVLNKATITLDDVKVILERINKKNENKKRIRK